MDQSHNNATPKFVGAVATCAVLIIAIYTLVLNNKPNDKSTAAVVATATTSAANTTTTAVNTATVLPTTTSAALTTSSTAYKDGMYEATVSYTVPHGYSNDLTTNITIKNGVITAVSTDSSYQDRESEQYVSSFESAVKSIVVGKKIDGSFSGRIGGASLTGSAFLDALDTITAQAKA